MINYSSLLGIRKYSISLRALPRTEVGREIGYHIWLQLQWFLKNPIANSLGRTEPQLYFPIMNAAIANSKSIDKK